MQTVTITLLLMLALAACNTIGGAGDDIQGGGEIISDTADDVQGEIFN